MEGISIGTKENTYSSSYLKVWKSTDSLIMSGIQWIIKERIHIIEWIVVVTQKELKGIVFIGNSSKHIWQPGVKWQHNRNQGSSPNDEQITCVIQMYVRNIG